MPSTPRITTYLTDSSGNQVYLLNLHPESGGTAKQVDLRLYNDSAYNTTSTILFVVRGDLLRSNPVGEDANESNSNGSELLSESWTEIKVGAGAWTPIDEFSGGGYDLGPITAGNYVSFSLRLNVPSGASTIGECNFNLAVRATA